MELTCENCGEGFEAQRKMKLCRDCSDDRAMKQLADIEPPKGGWPRGSTMDQL